MVRNLLGITIFVLSLVGAARQENEPEGWVVYSAGREPADDALECGNLSPLEWRVIEDVNDTVGVIPFERSVVRLPFELPEAVVTPQQGAWGPDGVLRVRDGWFVRYDRGEWGGALLWFDAEGQVWRRLVDRNVAGLVSVGDVYLAFASTPMGGEGEVYVLKPPAEDGTWVAESVLPLDAEPEVAISDGTSALLVTTDGISRVFRDGSVDILVRAPFAALFPNSLFVAKNGDLFVGMRHFVARIDPGERDSLDWLVPKQCSSFRVSDDGTTCDCL